MPDSFLDNPQKFPVKQKRPALGGTYSGLNLWKQHPDSYRAIVECLAAGFPVSHIAKRFQVSRDTIKAVEGREARTIAEDKDVLANMMRKSATLATTSIMSDLVLEAQVSEKLADLDPDSPDFLEQLRRLKTVAMSTRDKAVTAGILTEKAQALAGEASSIIEHVHSTKQPTHEDYIERLKQVTVIDVESEEEGGEGDS